MDRFEQHLFGTIAHGGLELLMAVAVAHDHQGRRGGMALHALEDLDAVEGSRHEQIDQDKIEALLFDQLERLHPVAGKSQRVDAAVEHMAGLLTQFGIIVDYQYISHGLSLQLIQW